MSQGTHGPCARFAVLVGPDGSGKSTLSRQLQALLVASGVECDVVNFRRRLIDSWLRGSFGDSQARVDSNPRGTAARSSIGSLSKVLVIWLDLWLTAAMALVDALRGRRVTLVERYAYDLFADPVRLGIAALPERLLGLLARTTPKPSIIFLCHAPAAVAANRKQELTEPEVETVYRRLGELLLRVQAPVRVVDTTHPVAPADVIGLVACWESAGGSHH